MNVGEWFVNQFEMVAGAVFGDDLELLFDGAILCGAAAIAKVGPDGRAGGEGMREEDEGGRSWSCPLPSASPQISRRTLEYLGGVNSEWRIVIFLNLHGCGCYSNQLVCR